MGRLLLLIFCVFACGAGCARPPASPEGAGRLTAAVRSELVAMRGEDKFQAGLFYRGPDLPEDGPALNAAVNTIIDALLARPDGPLTAADVLPAMKAGVDALDLFATEDRERGYRLMDKIWRRLGLSGDWRRQLD